MNKLALACLTAVTAASAALPSWSQAMSPMVYNGFIGGSAVAAAGRRARAINGLGSDGRPLGAAGRGLRASTTYRRDPAVTREVIDSVSAYAARSTGPQAAQQMRDVLARTDLEGAWAALTAPHGYQTGDAADSLAAYWALNWSMANGHAADERQMAGTREQIRATMPSNPAFARLGEAQRQAMSETYMLNYIIQHDAYGAALQRGDRAMLQRLSDAAEARFQNEHHFDLRRLNLTDQGFRQKG